MGAQSTHEYVYADAKTRPAAAVVPTDSTTPPRPDAGPLMMWEMTELTLTTCRPMCEDLLL